MTEPLTHKEQAEGTHFVPTVKIAVLFACGKYNSVYGIPNGYHGPGYVMPILKNLPEAFKEVN